MRIFYVTKCRSKNVTNVKNDGLRPSFLKLHNILLHSEAGDVGPLRCWKFGGGWKHVFVMATFSRSGREHGVTPCAHHPASQSPVHRQPCTVSALPNTRPHAGSF